MKCDTMSSFIVKNGDFVRLNASKSLIVRGLVARFLYCGELVPVRADDSEDVRVMHRCLSVVRDAGRSNMPIRVDACDSGAVYRFMLALLAVTEGEWHLTGTPRLLQRPVIPLVTALRSIGAAIAPASDGWIVTGQPLHADTVTVDCSQSSQFASALLLIGPKIGLKVLTTLPEVPPSEPYIAMTRYVVGEVLSGRPLRREADWSTAAFWYAFVRLSPDVNSLLLRDLRLDSIQGDCVISNIFSLLGVSSKQKDEGVLIEKNSDFTHILNLNLKLNPDLAPVLAVTAAMLGITCTLSGLGNLNLKESRRLDVLVHELAPFACVAAEGGTLRIDGSMAAPETLSPPVSIDSHGDHRMVMAFSLISFKYSIYLSDIECVKKSYPDFQNYFQPLGSIEK